jgi:hypothetical protein
MSDKIILRYGHQWKWKDAGTDLEIEMCCIRKGGHWKSENTGKQAGEGLFFHYRQMMSIIWPEDDHHRWSDLALRRIVENEVTVLLGSADSNKTYSMARFIICDWWTFSANTLWMVSSTELRGAELRIWGTLKQLFNRGREKFPWLPGTVLESKHCITTEEITEDGSEGRLLTKGIIFIPCKQGTVWKGMSAFIGIKPTKGGRLGHAGDEVSAMQPSFLSAYANWYGKENFKGILSANPVDLEDPSCVASEPLDGWESWHDTGKTMEWRSKFYGAWVVAFDGRDSPNNDFDGPKPKYPYLIGKKKLEAVAKQAGEDSDLFHSQCTGKPRPGQEAKKVISRRLCEANKAFEDVIWKGTPLVHIVSLDAAYGGVGGDRCVMMHSTFGIDVEDKQIFSMRPPVIVPVTIKSKDLPDIQIAKYCMDFCVGLGVPPENFFFDGRSTLAVAFARVWSANVNVVDFAGTPTERPVSLDEYIWVGDEKTRRLKKSSEHYSKFVTELWFSMYYAIVSGQVRSMPQEVAAEGCRRVWRDRGNKKEVETKAEMKARANQSPDLFDCAVTGLEGARRRGFNISKLANPESEERNWNFLDDMRRKSERVLSSKQLNYAA